MADVLKEAQDGPEYLYVSFDIDTIDPGFAPAPARRNPAASTRARPFRSSPALRPRQSGRIRSGRIRPGSRPGYVTGLVANRLLRECLTGVAMRKMGLAPDYLSPLTTDDNRE